MLRSRLKNIINKSKELGKENSFEKFKKSLPKELNIDNNYRLEAAWKAYGSPKNYKQALWEGLILPIDENNYKLPSIGYNEETDEYEYLNKGEDNETVAKDIRVWDNNVIPLVQELKLGGYVRTFNKEKDCWTYTKNSQKENSLDLKQNNFSLELSGKLIDSFLKGGKSSKKEKNDLTYAEFIATLPSNLLKGNDSENGYRMRYAFDNSPDVWTFDDAKGKFIHWNEDDLSWHGSSIFEPTGEFLKSSNHPTVWMEEAAYMSSKPKLIEGKEDNGNPENYVVVPMTGKEKEDMDNFRSRFNLVKTDKSGNLLKYWKYVPKQSTQAFKQGGAVIPSGSLHAHKNHMKLASEGLITPKGIPVISEENGEILLQAEIEREEVIFDKQATTDIEKLYKKFNETDKESEKNEIAIKAGKILTDIFINNTEDNTGLIEEVAEKNNLKYNK